MLLRLTNSTALSASEQWLKNVDQTHRLLASGKLVLQKYSFNSSCGIYK